MYFQLRKVSDFICLMVQQQNANTKLSYTEENSLQVFWPQNI